ncbi:hypothetical protein CL628_03320 [bacterium]|nr:hypothetical protein [bacterium]|tara:strand:+ start:102 stop:302 length:201 start_codon:yes stop_codon:yes gene_type:complete
MLIGLVLIVTGLVFFAKALGLITGDVIEVLWPLLLIVLGLGMLSHHMFGHTHGKWGRHLGEKKGKK